jgi:hypothetical protein
MLGELRLLLKSPPAKLDSTNVAALAAPAAAVKQDVARSVRASFFSL